jgi:hypothetical protein
MRLEVEKSPDRAEWDDGAERAGGSIFHSSAWANYAVRELPNVVPQFISLVSDAGERAGVALGFYEQSPKKLIKPLSGRLWFDAIPAVSAAHRDALGQFIRLLEEHARKEGAVELFFDSFAYRGGAAELEQAGFEVMRRLEFELGLELSEEELWSGLEYKRAKNIKKAMRSGVSIRNLPPGEGLLELRRLQSESGQRIIERGGPDITFRGRDGVDPVEVLLESGRARIMGAEVEGAIVSAGLFTNFNGLVYYNLSGHSRRALETQAGTLMLWETIKQYRLEGATRFNFGGCKFDSMNEDSPEHGVYVYKKAFGATCLECASGLKILRPAARKIVGTLKSVLNRAGQAE